MQTPQVIGVVIIILQDSLSNKYRAKTYNIHAVLTLPLNLTIAALICPRLMKILDETLTVLLWFQ